MPFQSFTIAEILKPNSSGDNGTELPSVGVKSHSHARDHFFPAYSSSVLFWNKPILSSMSNTERNAIPKSSAVDRPSKSSSSKTAHVESSSSKRRRSRTVFSDAQLVYLEERFTINKYLTTPDRTKVARSLGLTQLQIKTWYQNRRMRWKKAILRNDGHSAGGLSSCLQKNKGRPRKAEVRTRIPDATPPGDSER
ncbi:hypothetical protein RvY_00463 [Ramazzottius varieornatus]|uniref:Homeobox domain-containing protein n=1 Tax=Ramazzottius varieornatus TaxID=947166 RepID=A0A1D1UNA1_RAMVA|nr:hypothetical protein RvY_00463 [Ramazzottius varieornatus]